MGRIVKRADHRPWDGAMKVINPGDYILEITAAEDGHTAQNFAKSVVTFKIVSEASGKASKYAGDTLKGHYAHEGDGVTRTLQLAQALGVAIPEGDEEFDFDPAEHVGTKILGTVTNTPDQKDPNKKYNNIQNERRYVPPKAAPSAEEIEKLKGKKAS